MTEHRDLSEHYRDWVGDMVKQIVETLNFEEQSLAIAREAMINAFDREAERLDAQ